MQKTTALSKELSEAHSSSHAQITTLERQIRTLQDRTTSLTENLDDSHAQLADQERQFKHQINEVETKRTALQNTVDDIQSDLSKLNETSSATQSRLAERHADVERLEAEVLRLKADAGDREQLSMTQRQLSEQIAENQKAQRSLREAGRELERLRERQASWAVVEEQKRGLETELRVLQDVQRQLGEMQIQKELLEDERKAWTSLLEREGQEDEFESPEALAKALVQERIQHASDFDRLGKLEAELTEMEEAISKLETEKADLQRETEKLRSTYATAAALMPESKALRRVERQRTLVTKEVEYLRAQLKTFDAEETVHFPTDNNFDAQKAKQVEDLEQLVDEYRKEIQTLHEDISKQENASTPAPAPEARGTKRPLDTAEPEDERVHQLSKKNRKLQSTLAESQQKTSLLQTELEAAQSQLTTLQTRSRTRILELRSNPTAEVEAIKTSTLNALRSENKALLAQLESSRPDGLKVVPVSTLDTRKLEIQELERQVAGKEKMTNRLKDIFGKKAAEFRDAIASVLGFKVDFLPNDRVRVTSLYNPGNGNDDGEEKSIIFDGDKGTMKISGGPNSAFALEIRDLVRFWVQDKKEIPCFLAAMTLEFYDRTTKAQRF